jgi:hypothetical protein
MQAARSLAQAAAKKPLRRIAKYCNRAQSNNAWRQSTFRISKLGMGPEWSYRSLLSRVGGESIALFRWKPSKIISAATT